MLLSVLLHVIKNAVLANGQGHPANGEDHRVRWFRLLLRPFLLSALLLLRRLHVGIFFHTQLVAGRLNGRWLSRNSEFEGLRGACTARPSPGTVAQELRAGASLHHPSATQKRLKYLLHSGAKAG